MTDTPTPQADLVNRLTDSRHCNDWFLRCAAAAEIERLQASNADLRDGLTKATQAVQIQNGVIVASTKKLAACRAALRELVECDDKLQQIITAGRANPHATKDWPQIHGRNVAAWAAARAIVGKGE